MFIMVKESICISKRLHKIGNDHTALATSSNRCHSDADVDYWPDLHKRCGQRNCTRYFHCLYTSVISRSIILKSCIFHPLRFGPSFSGPAFSNIGLIGMLTGYNQLFKLNSSRKICKKHDVSMTHPSAPRRQCRLVSAARRPARPARPTHFDWSSFPMFSLIHHRPWP